MSLTSVENMMRSRADFSPRMSGRCTVTTSRTAGRMISIASRQLNRPTSGRRSTATSSAVSAPWVPPIELDAIS